MLARSKQSKKDDQTLHRAIISDIVLWMILVLALAVGVYWFAIRMPEMNGQTILLKFRDANQITRGSAVTMLGTDVGFVKNIRIHRDHVDVLVQTFSRSLAIPSGATFTVLFNGLAGSKSIDIEVPRMPMPEINGQPIYIVAEPIRLKTLLDYMVDMTQALTAGANNITDFFGKRKPVEELQFNIHQAHQQIQESLDSMQELDTQMRTFQHDVHQSTVNGLQTAQRFKKRARYIEQIFDPAELKPQVNSVLTSIQMFRQAVVPDFPGGSSHASRGLERWRYAQSVVDPWITTANRYVSLFPLDQILTRIEAGEDRFIAFLDQAQAFLQCNDKQQLQQLRQNIQTFNRHILTLNLKLEASSGNNIRSTPRVQPYTPCCPPLQTPRQPAKPPVRPPSAHAVKPFPIVDRSGAVQRHADTWWDRHPAAKKQAPPTRAGAYSPPKQKKPSLVDSILQGAGNLAGQCWSALVDFLAS